MSEKNGMVKSKVYFEIITFAIALLIAIVMMIPLYNNTSNYSFYLSNFIFIFLFITFSRYIFFLRFSAFSHNMIVKLLFIFSTIPLAFLLTEAFSNFQKFADNIGLQEFVTQLNGNEQAGMMAYIRNQMLFFGAGSIVTCILLSLRLIVSIWRVKNRGTV